MGSGPSDPTPSSTNKDAADDGTTDLVPSNVNVDTSIGSCEMPDTTKDNGMTLTLGRKTKFISKIGEHYDLKVQKGVEKVICKYFKKALGDASRIATKRLRDHQGSCPMRKHRKIAEDFSPKKLKVGTFGDQKRKLSYGNPVYFKRK